MARIRSNMCSICTEVWTEENLQPSNVGKHKIYVCPDCSKEFFKYQNALGYFTDEMLKYIDVKYPKALKKEKWTKSEASEYLGHSCRDMSMREIKEEIANVKLEYYHSMASLSELTDLFLSLKEDE